MSEKSKVSARELAVGFTSFRQGNDLVPKGAVVELAPMAILKSSSAPTYRQIQSRFKADLTSKDARFNLSAHVANQLSVEEEEERRFQNKVTEELESRLSLIRAEAQAEGVEKGRQEGKDKAYEEEKVRWAQSIENMAMAVNSIEKARELLGTQYEARLVDLAYKFAEVIIHAEIQYRPEVVSATMNSILERLAKDDDVRVRLSSAAFEVLDKVKDEVAKATRSGRIGFDLDQNLAPGDCVVESLSGEIASIVKDKLEKLKVEITNRSQLKTKETGT